MRPYSIDRRAGLAAFILSLAVYLFTLAPTVTLEQSGHLIVSAEYLTVGRHPGYPVWHLIAKLFVMAFGWIPYRGHPNPALAVHGMSAFFGALSCGLLAWIVSRQTAVFFRSGVRAVCAVSAALVWGFSRPVWAAAVVAETHLLTNFYLLLYLAVLCHWMRRPDHRLDAPVAFMTGLGLTVSPLFALYLPVALTAALLRKGSSTNGVGVLLNTVSFLAGLLPIAYLWLYAVRPPAPTMGGVWDWESFMHVISRGQYERLQLLNIFLQPVLYAKSLLWLASSVLRLFSLPVVLALLLSPLTLYLQPRRKRKVWILLGAALLALGPLLMTGLYSGFDVQTSNGVLPLLMPFLAVCAICAGHGLAGFMSRICSKPR